MSTTQLREGTFVHQVSPELFQVGSTPEHAVLFSDLTEEEKDWLRSLLPKGRVIPGRQSGRGNQSAGGSLTERQQEMLLLLENASLLGPEPNPLPRLRIRIVGLDRVGILLSRLLVAAGIRHLDLRDSSRVNAEVENLFPADAKGLVRARILQQELAKDKKLRLGRITYPDLVVTCNSRVWDHARSGLLLSHDVNHLPIVTDDRSIQVGPFIAPGITACAVCVDMHVRDAFPTWPDTHLALRNATPVTPSHHMAATAAGLAASMIESVALGIPITPGRGTSSRDPEDPQQEGNLPPGAGSATSHSWRVTQRGVQTRTWTRHPDCGCSAAGLGLEKSAS